MQAIGTIYISQRIIKITTHWLINGLKPIINNILQEIWKAMSKMDGDWLCVQYNYY